VNTPRENALLAVETDSLDGRRLWAAFMLALDVGTCAAILRGQRVMVSRLDPVALRRALRGGTPPEPSDFLLVTGEMLDAIDECGPFVVVKGKQR